MGAPSSIHQMLELAVNCARKSGSYLIAHHKKAQQVQENKARDVKIKGDVLSESIIIEQLQNQSGIPLFSEEKGMIGTPDLEEPIWIIDPLDGSLNFSRNIPLCCISIGLWQGNEPVLGVVFDFNRNELFSAIVGEGAWLNQEKIHTSQTTGKENGIICTGFPRQTDFSSQGLVHFINKVQSYKKVRLFGTAALSLAYVSCGRADAYQEDNIMIWDVAAGCALVRAAGGHVKIDRTGDLQAPVNVHATNGKI